MFLIYSVLLGDMSIGAEYITIGDIGNAADSNGYGGVNYYYKISKHEVTIMQFQQAVDAGDGDENYWNDGTRTVGSSAPAVNLTLNEAKKYCNYLTSGNIRNGVYQFNNGITNDSTGTLSRGNIIYNNSYSAWYALTTEDEWYKAAYYTGNTSDAWSSYTHGSNSVPIHGTTNGWNYYSSGFVGTTPNYVWPAGHGAEEQNGTHDMMGNVWDVMQSGTVGRGGSYYNYATGLRSAHRNINFIPHNEVTHAGIRVVKIIPNWTAPTVYNDIASEITGVSAVLKGTVINTGGEDPDITIYWGEVDGGVTPGNWEHSISKGAQNSGFSAAVSVLDQNKRYYYRCFAINSVGFDWTDYAGSFVTLIQPMAIVSIMGVNNTNIIVEWYGTNGWNYSLQECTDLLVPVWGGVLGGTNIPGANGIMSVTNYSVKHPRQFYRVIGSK